MDITPPCNGMHMGSWAWSPTQSRVVRTTAAQTRVAKVMVGAPALATWFLLSAIENVTLDMMHVRTGRVSQQKPCLRQEDNNCTGGSQDQEQPIATFARPPGRFCWAPRLQVVGNSMSI
jgi:hypothetical protein